MAGSREVAVASAGSWRMSFLQILPNAPLCQASLHLPTIRSALTAPRFIPRSRCPSPLRSLEPCPGPAAL